MSSSEELNRKIIEFLTEEASRGEHRTLTSLELLAAQPGQRGVSLQSWDRISDPDLFAGNLSRIEDLTSKIVAIAQDYARDLGGGVRFVLKTVQHLGGRHQMSFRVESDLEDSEGGDGPLTDAPNAQGLTSQLMRHLELKERTMLQMYQATLGTMSATIRGLAEENQQLRRDRVAQFTELEMHRSQQAERDLRLLEADSLVKRKDMLFTEFTKLLPVVASRFATGGDDAPVAAEQAALRSLITQLGSSLTDEQKAKIAAALTPAQGMLLMETFRVVDAATQPSPGNDAQGQHPSQNQNQNQARGS